MDARELVDEVRSLSAQLRETDESAAKRLVSAAETNVLPTEIFLAVYEELGRLVDNLSSDSAVVNQARNLIAQIRLELKNSGLHLK